MNKTARGFALRGPELQGPVRHFPVATANLGDPPKSRNPRIVWNPKFLLVSLYNQPEEGGLTPWRSSGPSDL